VLLIVIGSVAAMSLAMLVLVAMCRAGVYRDETLEHAEDDPRTPRGIPGRTYSDGHMQAGESGRDLVAWGEIAKRTGRPPRPRSTMALRRRHLAAVLPADARR
jgi:hypothetical protein